MDGTVIAKLCLRILSLKPGIILATFIPSLSTFQHLFSSTSYSTPAHFIFSSSISAVSLATPPVPEAPDPFLTYAANTDYDRSELIAEKSFSA